MASSDEALTHDDHRRSIDGVSRIDVTLQQPDAERIQQSLLQFVSEVAGYATRDDLIRSLSTHLRDLVPYDQLAIVLHDPVTNTLRLELQTPEERLAPALPFPLDRIPVDFGPAGQVWRTQATLDFSLEGEQTHPMLRYLQAEGYRAICLVPLTTPRTRLGTLGFGSQHIIRYPPGTIVVMERIARLLAMTLEHTAQLEALGSISREIAGERDRIRLLLDLTNAVASELHLADLLVVISNLMRDVIHHHFASLTLWDAESGQLRRRALVSPSGGMENEPLLANTTVPPRLAFDQGKTLTLRLEGVAALDPSLAEALTSKGLHSLCCVPLHTARGRYGTLNVARPEDAEFSTDEVQLLEQVSQQLAVAIENAIHHEQAEQLRRETAAQRDRLRLLLDVNNALVSRIGSGPLELSVLETVRAAVPHDYASVAILDAEAKALKLEAITFYDERGLTAPRTRLPLDSSPAGLAFVERKALVFDDLGDFPEHGVAGLLREGIQSICCVPLMTARGVIGTLNIGRRSRNACSPDQVALLEEVGAQVAIAVENVLAFHEISSLKDRLKEEKLYLEGEITRQHDFKEIIGNSEALTRVLNQIRTVAPTDSTVLLLGETGTGKELLARALHALSRRSERTFVRVNGAALPAGLIESELFGSEKGAFTGAVATKIGRLELADRGTLFLDEVGDLPLDVQPKLLRALQEREFERLGSTRTRQVNVRLIAATNRHLDEMVSAGTFRSDLFYRLSVFPIHVPPLRERPEDIPALVQHFATRFSREMGRSISAIPTSVMQQLMHERWPGNIRELQNVVERAVILSRGASLLLPEGVLRHSTTGVPAPLSASVPVLATSAPTASPASAAAPPTGLDYRSSERDAILRALRDTNGVIGGSDGAAARLGLKRTTLHSKMRKLGINRPSF